VTSLRPLVLALLFGCDPPVPTLSQEDVPERQFIFEGVRIEERRDGKLVWLGRAGRADGDINQTVAKDIRMTRKAQSETEQDYDIDSPRGTLDFSQLGAVFETVRITDAGGGVVNATAARYEEKSRRIYVDGPLEFSARGLTAHAREGEMKLDEGSFDIVGPVEGRFEPPK
jgi:hypothetical protein